MTFLLATFLILLIICFVALLREYQKNKKIKRVLKEKNLSNKRTTKVFNAVFQNIHAYILVIDKNLIVQKTNFYQRTNKVDDGKEKRVGDLLCCQNAIISGRCGTHKRCQDCVINGTITRAFSRKQSFSEIKATLTLSTEPDNYMQVEAIVSGSYIDMENEESMVVTIHNITNLMTNKRENERLNDVISFTCALKKVGFAYLNLITNEEVITPEYLTNLNEMKNVPVSNIFKNFHNVYPEYKEALFDFLNQARTSKVEPLKKTVKIITKDDSIKWVRIYLIQKDFQPEKNINDIYSLTIDVTGRKEKERIMTVDKEKAENADRSKSAFLANMSHEIRTPLNAIVGFSELLAGATSNEEKEQYLEILKMNNSMLLQLINDILDMSKIEAGTLEFNFTDVNINVLMSDLERLFQMRLEGNELVKIVFEPSLPKYVISTDRNRLGQVLSNFLSNAVKFTEVGTIRMGYKLYEDGVYFYVSDTGAGMNKEMLDNLFTRFARFHKEKQGNGLGLSISKTIIEKLGGTIGAESVYQKGSTFWFILPNKPSEGHAEEETKVEEVIEIKEEAPQKEAEVPLSQSKKGVILIAENSEEVFAPMQDVLSIDYKVLHARTGEEAILTYFQEEPQLVLMALQMPDVDGYQATEAIRQMSTSLPIVALADDDSVDKTEVMNNGFSDVLVKPVSRETLIDTVTRFIK